MDREERLKVAKEKLRKFQELKRHKESGGGEVNHSNANYFRQSPGLNSNDLPVMTVADTQPEEQLMEAKGIHDRSGLPLTDVVSDESSCIPPASSAGEQPLAQPDEAVKASELNADGASFEKETQHLKASLDSETEALRSQLDSHAETVKILVSEKTDFQASLDWYQSELKAKGLELDALKASHSNQEAKAERAHEVAQQVESKTRAELEALKEKWAEAKQAEADLRQEVQELRNKLSRKESELSKLRAEDEQRAARLELAELNLAQLRSSQSEEDKSALLEEGQRQLQRLTAENEEQAQRVMELAAYIQQASADREQIILQYTSYSQQLANKIEEVSQQLNASLQENHQLASREKELLAHVQQVEQQLQKVMQEAKAAAAERTRTKQDTQAVPDQTVDLLNANIVSLQADKAAQQVKIGELSALLTKREDELSDLEAQLEMARINSSDISQEDLVAACQSDKVAASRAMLQNKELKDQLEELQSALIQITNSKAQLMNDNDTLQKQRSKLDAETSALKMELSGLQSAIEERDRNINHMKKQMKYYIAFAENSITGHLDSSPRPHPDADKEQIRKLIDELQAAREEIRSLNSHNCELRSQLDVLSSRTHDHSETPDTREQDEPSQVSSLASSRSSPTTTPASPADAFCPTDVAMDGPHCASVPLLSQDVALLKLEQKFNHSMVRIAELTSERDHLEHIVVQLQEETNTVGDYITFYQYQRQQQKKRLEEKELQLQQVCRDREDLKTKLVQLQSMLSTFVKAGRNDQHHQQQQQAWVAADEGTNKTGSSDANGCGTESPQPTADQILALLSEIESNQMLVGLDNFQPWFWGSSPGKLMIV